MSSRTHSNGKQNCQATSHSHTLVWACISVGIGALSIYAVLDQSKQISMHVLFERLLSMNKAWLLAAIGCVLAYVFFEACAIKASVILVGGNSTIAKCWSYSAADIYFSAITPSATGGQPASAFLMMKDKIPGAKTTAALLINLVMYSGALVVIGVICVLTRPAFIMRFGLTGRVLIVVGLIVQLGLAGFFVLLIKNEQILLAIGEFLIKFLNRIHLLAEKEEHLLKLHKGIGQFKNCLAQMGARKRYIGHVFVYNFLQRASQIAVTMCVYLAFGGGNLGAFDLWALQSFILIGANYIPIPGGMGVTDFLMLDGFSSFFSVDQSVTLEMISRYISFYFCILICGCLLLFRIRDWALKRKETKS